MFILFEPMKVKKTPESSASICGEISNSNNGIYLIFIFAELESFSTSCSKLESTPLNSTFGVDAKNVLATKPIVIRVIFYLLIGTVSAYLFNTEFNRSNNTIIKYLYCFFDLGASRQNQFLLAPHHFTLICQS